MQAAVFGRLWWVVVVAVAVAMFARVSASPLAGDLPPRVVSTVPGANETGVALSAGREGGVVVTFSEPVAILGAGLMLECEQSRVHGVSASGGPTTWRFVSDRAFRPGELCLATVRADQVADLDGEPPEFMEINHIWQFHAAHVGVVINEVDAVSPRGEGDFIELFDGGRGDTDLSGLSLVLYRGDEAEVYLALGLDGKRTDEDGYFVVGASGVAGVDHPLIRDSLRDGPGGVAIYSAPESEFPIAAPVTTVGLLDAVVYGAGADGLLPLLLGGEEPLDEEARGRADSDSNQRCPNGGGEPRETRGFVQQTPTPGARNNCPTDDAPEIMSFSPAADATHIPLDAEISITFSEPVDVEPDAVTITCARSAAHSYTTRWDGDTMIARPTVPFASGESCTVKVVAAGVKDKDSHDPPDTMRVDVMWSFSTIPYVDRGIMVNEFDADTPGTDTAEFIELYDGGKGNTPLDGLVVVLFNGADDKSYLAIELDGESTDSLGYYVIGNSGVAGVDKTVPTGILQNGPDAIALSFGYAADFPNGTPVSAIEPLDAVVYGRLNQIDNGLLPLLNSGQPQIDENGRGASAQHSSQRCPNGAGGARNTTTYRPNNPTPGAVNICISDDPPTLTNRTPKEGATGVDIRASITVEFSEPVTVQGQWMTVQCQKSGGHTHKTTGGPTTFTVAPDEPFAYSESCSVTVHAGQVRDKDTDDPPDTMTANVSWSFQTAAPPPDFILINEFDADTPGTDTAEFIELYDGGRGNTSLSGLVVVLVNGADDKSYFALGLDGETTDENGYLVIGNPGIKGADVELPAGTLQNGTDAIVLAPGIAANFPNGTPVSAIQPLDAVVYGQPNQLDNGLLPLLKAGQPQIDENGRGAAEQHSNQRCPNGGGGARNTTTYRPNTPSPGATNHCTVDEPPAVTDWTPNDGETGVGVGSHLTVQFSEAVTLQGQWLTLQCQKSGGHTYNTTGGPVAFTVTPDAPLAHSESCTATIHAGQVRDQDTDDPPDTLPANVAWSFSTAAPPPDFVLINEIDSDTPGADKAEFIELFDGGQGRTALDGLVLVFFNGGNDRAYHAVDLSGYAADAEGYFVVGNAAVSPDLVIPNNVLQNGPDAVALYIGSATQFPNNTSITTSGLIDAVVYGQPGAHSAKMLSLLTAGEKGVDENGRGATQTHSLQRCPNGSGGQRRTAAIAPNPPTPGAVNACETDSPPAVVSVSPKPGADSVPVDVVLTVEFSEPVALTGKSLSLYCSVSGDHSPTVSGGPAQFTAKLQASLASNETCEATVSASAVRDLDTLDPPDGMEGDYLWSFTTESAPAAEIIINEIDPDTVGEDTHEFIELYDGGSGESDLTGVVVVLWNGSDATSYRAFDLAGHMTGTDGYFVLGNAAVGADLVFGSSSLQNGPDGAAIYRGSAADFPDGTPLTTAGLIDAVVYGTGAEASPLLLSLLEAGQLPLDENGRGSADVDSLARCPNGEGGARRTSPFRPDEPTPGGPNACAEVIDEPPAVATVTPADGAEDVPVVTQMAVDFTEDVVVDASGIEVLCDVSGRHAVSLSGGPRLYQLALESPLAAEEQCAVTIQAAAVRDTDPEDPPDGMASDFVWSFRTTAIVEIPPPIAHFNTNSPIWIGDEAKFINESGGTGPLVYRWSFGDGSPESSATHPTHRYARVGAYTVRLTVEGPGGADSYAAVVVVRERVLFLGVVGR